MQSLQRILCANVTSCRNLQFLRCFYPLSVYLKIRKSVVVKSVKTISVYQEGESCTFLMFLHDILPPLAVLQAFCWAGKEGKKWLRKISTPLGFSCQSSGPLRPDIHPSGSSVTAAQNEPCLSRNIQLFQSS